MVPIWSPAGLIDKHCATRRIYRDPEVPLRVGIPAHHGVTGGRAVPRSKNDCFQNRDDYFEAMVGFTQPFFITPCDGRKLR